MLCGAEEFRKTVAKSIHFSHEYFIHRITIRLSNLDQERQSKDADRKMNKHTKQFKRECIAKISAVVQP